jgi:hypothetical protein
VNGATVFSEICQPDAEGDQVAAVTHWTNASFDDVLMTDQQQ